MMHFWDAIIIGAGPAGLTAAVHLARFRRSTLVLHDGASRAARIPLTHNVPGWPQGIPGAQLLAQIAAQAGKYGASFHETHVERVEKGKNRLRGRSGAGRNMVITGAAAFNRRRYERDPAGRAGP